MSWDSRQNLRFTTLLQAKKTSLYFTWRSHVFLHGSKAVVEEAGVQAGRFLLLWSLEKIHKRPAALSFDLSGFHVNRQDSNRMQDFLSDSFCGCFWEIATQLEGFCGCCYSYPGHLCESDCSHSLAHGVKNDVLIHHPFIIFVCVNIDSWISELERWCSSFKYSVCTVCISVH